MKKSQKEFKRVYGERKVSPLTLSKAIQLFFRKQPTLPEFCVFPEILYTHGSKLFIQTLTHVYVCVCTFLNIKLYYFHWAFFFGHSKICFSNLPLFLMTAKYFIIWIWMYQNLTSPPVMGIWFFKFIMNNLVHVCHFVPVWIYLLLLTFQFILFT